MITKVKIYNLALSALLLSKEVTEIETDKSSEVRALNTHWDAALNSTLEDLDLDSLMTSVPLELITTLTEGPWTYVYKYPNNCAFFRRIKSCAVTDNRSTFINKQIGIYSGQQVIFSNEPEAVAECIFSNLNLANLSQMAAMAIAYKLAFLSAPMVVGKGSKTLREEIKKDYIIAKTEAQEKDARENFRFESDALRSEFVQARLS